MQQNPHIYQHKILTYNITYNAFFFFLIPLSLSLCESESGIKNFNVVTAIYNVVTTIIMLFCLINYNIYYEFSDFCFCMSCYSFIYLLKLNIIGDFTKINTESEKSFYVYYCTTLGVSLLICSSYII